MIAPRLASATSAQLPERTVTTFAADGISITDGPRRFGNIVAARLRNPRSVRSSLQIDFPITEQVDGTHWLSATLNDRRFHRRQLLKQHRAKAPLCSATSAVSRYRELQLLAIYDNPRIGTCERYLTCGPRLEAISTPIDNFLGDFPCVRSAAERVRATAL